MSLNKVQLIGNIGKDPEIRALDSGAKVATFSVATTEKGYTLKNGTQVPERTEWHNIVLWNGLAEIAEKYLHKGDKVYIEGKIRSRSYEDSKSITRYVTEIFGENMEMLVTKQPHQNVQQQYPQQPPQQQYSQQPQQYPQPQQCQRTNNQGTIPPWEEPHQQGRFPWDDKPY